MCAGQFSLKLCKSYLSCPRSRFYYLSRAGPSQPQILWSRSWVCPVVRLSSCPVVRACIENLLDQFSCRFADCLLLWSSCACPSMIKFFGPLPVFQGEGKMNISHKRLAFSAFLWHRSCEQSARPSMLKRIPTQIAVVCWWIGRAWRRNCYHNRFVSFPYAASLLLFRKMCWCQPIWMPCCSTTTTLSQFSSEYEYLCTALNLRNRPTRSFLFSTCWREKLTW